MDGATHVHESCDGAGQVERPESWALCVNCFLDGLALSGRSEATRVGFRRNMENALAHVYRTGRNLQWLDVRSYVRLHVPWSANI